MKIHFNLSSYTPANFTKCFYGFLHNKDTLVCISFLEPSKWSIMVNYMLLRLSTRIWLIDNATDKEHVNQICLLQAIRLASPFWDTNVQALGLLQFYYLFTPHLGNRSKFLMRKGVVNNYYGGAWPFTSREGVGGGKITDQWLCDEATLAGALDYLFCNELAAMWFPY